MILPYPYDTPQKRRPTPADCEQLWEDGNFVGGAMILVITLLSFLFSIVATVLVANGVLAADDLTSDTLGLSNTRFLLLYGAVYAASMGLPTLLSLLLFRKKLPKFSGRPRLTITLNAAFIGIGACILANIVANIFSSVFEQYGFHLPDAPSYLEATPQSLAVNLLVMALLPAILEELLFRVTLLGTLRRYGDGPAVLLSALLFGVMHGYAAQSLFAFLVGLVLGWLTVATGNVSVAVAIHFFNNALSVVLEYARMQLSETEGNILSALCMYGLLLLGLVLFIVTAVRRSPLMRLPQKGELKVGACIGRLTATPLAILSLVLLILRAAYTNFCT